jgi:hypothetical protein
MEMGVASWFSSVYNGLAGEMRSRRRIRHVAGFSHVHRMGVAFPTSKK